MLFSFKFKKQRWFWFTIKRKCDHEKILIKSVILKRFELNFSTSKKMKNWLMTVKLCYKNTFWNEEGRALQSVLLEFVRARFCVQTHGNQPSASFNTTNSFI